MKTLEQLLRELGAKYFIPLQKGYVGVVWSNENFPLISVHLKKTPFKENDQEIRIGKKDNPLLLIRKPVF